MAGYVWNGVPEPPAMPAPKRPRAPREMRKNVAACGTYSGYKSHRVRGEEACHQCKEAMAAYCREYRARIKSGEIVVRKSPIPNCGTHSGYARHLANGDTACQDCRIAHATYMRAYNAKRAGLETSRPVGRPPRLKPELCGTPAGYGQHFRWKQRPCEACKQARKVYDAEYLARKKAA